MTFFFPFSNPVTGYFTSVFSSANGSLGVNVSPRYSSICRRNLRICSTGPSAITEISDLFDGIVSELQSTLVVFDSIFGNVQTYRPLR